MSSVVRIPKVWDARYVALRPVTGTKNRLKLGKASQYRATVTRPGVIFIFLNWWFAPTDWIVFAYGVHKNIYI